MTDQTDPEMIDLQAIVLRHAAEQAERRLEAEALRPANKTALFDALAAAGITEIIVTFDGYGDSGQIEDIDARAGDRPASLPQTEITVFSPVWGSGEITPNTLTVETAIEQIVYELLSETHGGWENNDGAYGEFVFDVAARAIALEHNERYTATETFNHVF